MMGVCLAVKEENLHTITVALNLKHFQHVAYVRPPVTHLLLWIARTRECESLKLRKS